MRADNVNQRVLLELMDFHPETVFVGLGGNDISVNSSPRQTSKKRLFFLTMVLKTCISAKSRQKDSFQKRQVWRKKFLKRKEINKHLRKKYGRFFVTFSDIYFPEHYDKNKFHLNAKRTVKVPGMKKFQFRLSRVLCRHWTCALDKNTVMYIIYVSLVF